MKFRKKTTATLLIAVFILSTLVMAIPFASAITINVNHAGGGDYLTIQEAITAASQFDTIVVFDGTYTESLLILTDDLTLMSENGPGSTTIRNVGNAPSGQQTGIDIDADNFVLGGEEGHGFTIEGGDAPRLMQLTHGESGVEISYNIIDLTGTEPHVGINIGAAGATGLTVSYNQFSLETNDMGIVGTDINPSTGFDISYNEFTGPGYSEPTWTQAVDLSDVTDSTFSHNVISDMDKGINIEHYTTSAADLTISHNDITGVKWGVQLQSGVDATGVTIFHNSLVNCLLGVFNTGDGTVDAEYNWWGTSVESEIASMVSGLVDYVPWLSESPIGMEVEVEPATYTLTLTIVGSGSVTIDGETYEESQVIVLDNFAGPDPEFPILASGANYWKFFEWTDDLTGTEPSETLTLTGNLAVTATFVPKTVSIVVPGSVNFGTVLVGTSSLKQKITVENTGEVDVTVTADTADAWYQTYLQIGPFEGGLSAYDSGWDLSLITWDETNFAHYDLQLVAVQDVGSHDAVLVLTATPTGP